MNESEKVATLRAALELADSRIRIAAHAARDADQQAPVGEVREAALVDMLGLLNEASRGLDAALAATAEPAKPGCSCDSPTLVHDVACPLSEPSPAPRELSALDAMLAPTLARMADAAEPTKCEECKCCGRPAPRDAEREALLMRDPDTGEIVPRDAALLPVKP